MAWEIEVDRGSKEYAKLTMNELSFGPLPEARAAAMEAISRANRYPARRRPAQEGYLRRESRHHGRQRDGW